MWHKLETAAEYYEQWPPALMEQPAECRWHYLELFGIIIQCITISGDTLCRDNCQLIGMPFFYTRSAGKNNRN